MINLPHKFVQNMEALLGNTQSAKFFNCYNEPYIKCMRVNTLKAQKNNVKQAFSSIINSEVDYENAFIVDSETKIGSHPYHHAGAIYMQEASAMLPALTISYNADDLVLDMCSSPGGKSSQIALRIPNGTLVSNEIITNRAIVLKENIERLGLTNVIVTSTTPENLTRLGAIFDKVIVDAPCSGEGIFRKEPNSIKQWHENINELNKERQLSILACAAQLCRDGGQIVYSTCTFSPLENEQVALQFLKDNPNFFFYEISKTVLDNTSAGLDNIGRRVYPHLNLGEGQYMVVFEKRQTEPYIHHKQNPHLRKLTLREHNLVQSFFSENLTDYDIENVKLYAHDNIIVLAPPIDINTKNLYTLKYGVNLGEIVKNRFEPHHNLFSALGHKFKNKLCFSTDDPLLLSYLKGQAIDIDKENLKGYVCIMVDNIALGGAKATNGRLNNIYPKHLRNV